MCALLYNLECLIQKKQHCFIKENSVFKFLDEVLSVSCQTKFIYMVRDPRDMALSWKNGPVMRGHLRASKRWLDDQIGFHSLLSGPIKTCKFSMVRYEDLLENPAEEIKRICDEIEIDFSTSMINFNENSSSAIKDAGKSAMWSNLKRPIISTNKGKFISGLSQTELEYVEGLCSGGCGIRL